MAAVRRRPEAPAEPTFVFKGSVKKLNSATTKRASARQRTAVVRVDEVVEANPQLAALAGQDVTVQLSGRVKTGDQLMLHTIPLMFGDNVSLRAVKQEPLSAATKATGAGDPVARKRSRDLQDRFAQADVVVSGRVTAIAPPAGERDERGAPMPAASSTAGRPATEHDPNWKDAVVEIDAVHKGRPVARTITVRFPASTDVGWYPAPKLREGQYGLFMLQKRRVDRAPRGRKAPRGRGSAASGAVYTALHTADFQPFNDGDAKDLPDFIRRP